MATLVILIVEGALALAIAVALVVIRNRNDRLALRRRVVVNKHDGTALDGVLWARRGRTLVLKNALLLQTGLEPAPIDGEVLVDRDNVDFVQVRPGSGD